MRSIAREAFFVADSSKFGREALFKVFGMDDFTAGITDESSAVEALGHAPLLVPGEAENFKLTWPADFALAQRLLETR